MGESKAKPRGAAIAEFLAVSMVVAAATGASGASVTHTLIGVASNVSYSVAVEGAGIAASPVTADESGILSFGFDDALYGNPPLTVAVVPSGELIIGGVAVTDVGETSAVVSWTTNLPSDSRVEYGPTESYGLNSATDPTLLLEHEVLLEGLSDGRVYHLRVHSNTGEEASSSEDLSFETELSPLELWGAGVALVDSTTATLTWQTNRVADSQVEFGVTAAYGQSSPLHSSLVEEHSVLLEGLLSGTTYHYRVRSEDSNGLVVYSSDDVFATEVVPLRVLGVESDDVGTEAAVIRWTTNRASSSGVEYGQTEDLGSATVVDVEPVVDHAVALSGLQPGSVYYYRVRSEDGFRDIAYSEIATLETDRVPLEVSGVEITELTPESAAISWSTNREADSCVEYGATVEYGVHTAVDSTLVTEHAVTVEGLEPGRSYHFRVCSEDGFGDVAASADSTLNTPMPPLAISDVVVSGVTQSQATITWMTDRPANSNVRYGITEGHESEVGADSLCVTSHSMTLTGLADETLYHFTVVSTDSAGVTASSTDSTFATMSIAQTGPPKIDSFTVSAMSPTTVVVTWETDKPATSLVRYGRGDELDMSAGGDPTLVLTHCITIRPVNPNRTYSFMAESEADGFTTVTESLVYKAEYTGHTLVKKEPTIIKFSVSSLSDTSALVTWATDRPCSTWVEFGGNELYQSHVDGETTGGVTYSAALNGLRSMADYHFRVCAWDEFGGLGVTEDRTFTTLAAPDVDPPACPEGVTLNDYDGVIVVSWEPVSDADVAGYRVYRDEVSDMHEDGVEHGICLTDVPIGDTIYDDDEVEFGRVYVYRVSAVDDSGNESSLSEAARIDYRSGTGVSFSVYPNPMFDTATFAFSIPGTTGERVSMRILSVTGRVIRELVDGYVEPGTHTAAWDGCDRTGRLVRSGVYLLEFASHDNVSRKKLTVMH